MSCSRSVVLLNNALKIAVMKNGDLSLIQLGLDKEKREITESVIAIYQNELISCLMWSIYLLNALYFTSKSPPWMN